MGNAVEKQCIYIYIMDLHGDLKIKKKKKKNYSLSVEDKNRGTGIQDVQGQNHAEDGKQEKTNAEKPSWAEPSSSPATHPQLGRTPIIIFFYSTN